MRGGDRFGGGILEFPRDRQRLGCGDMASASVKVSGDRGLRRGVGRASGSPADAQACRPRACRGPRALAARRASCPAWSSGCRWDRPLVASRTSSKDFFRSAISASRIASLNWPWNSPAILRALPIHWPIMRSTPGSSFGPMAISATTAMTSSSLHPMSNMKLSAHARLAPIPAPHRRPACPVLPQAAVGIDALRQTLPSL